jgi:hypothetical protein
MKRRKKMKKRRLTNVIPRILSLIFLAFFSACGGGGGGDSGGGSSAAPPPASTPEASSTIGPAGGTLEITETSSPLYGVKVEIPGGALNSNTTITISLANPEPPSPNTAEKVSKTISLGPEGIIFNSPVSISIPYNQKNFDESSLQIYEYNGYSWEGVTFKNLNSGNNIISALTGHFSQYAVLAPKATIPAADKFDPAIDGFSIENFSPVAFPKGVCAGMATYALWFYENVFYENVRCSLDDAYDDDTEKKVAEGAHRELENWNIVTRDDVMEEYLLYYEPGSVINELINKLKVSGPQIVGVDKYDPITGKNTFSHTILVYNYDGIDFEIYDPNYPDEVRRLKNVGGILIDNDYGFEQKYLVITSQFYNGDTSSRMETVFKTFPFYIAGNWTVTETATATCTWQGQSETETSTGTGTLNILQSGSSVNWTSTVNPNPMTGTITGNKIQVSGKVGILQIDPGATVTSNIYNGRKQELFVERIFK